MQLGTAYSCVGVFNMEKWRSLQMTNQGNHFTPSYAAFTDTERLIGEIAKSQVNWNPSLKCHLRYKEVN